MSENDRPEDEFSAEELAQAAALAGSVDQLLEGTQKASADERAQDLIRHASMIHAAHHDVALSAQRRASLIEEAFASATGAGQAHFEHEGSNDLARARLRRQRRWGAGIVTLAAAAALVFLFLRPESPSDSAPSQALAVHMQILPTETSRPADALVGQIPPTDSGLASERVRLIYANRLAGYRSLEYRRKEARR